jgi:C-terminal processing protease CtpA/Prc
MLNSILRAHTRMQELDTDYTTCVIKADENGSFGVLFNGARNRADSDAHAGVFISGTKPGSPASRAEGMEVGWEIVRISGSDMRGATFDDLNTVLKNLGDTLTMKLEPNPGEGRNVVVVLVALLVVVGVVVRCVAVLVVMVVVVVVRVGGCESCFLL